MIVISLRRHENDFFLLCAKVIKSFDTVNAGKYDFIPDEDVFANSSSFAHIFCISNMRNKRTFLAVRKQTHHKSFFLRAPSSCGLSSILFGLGNAQRAEMPKRRERRRRSMMVTRVSLRLLRLRRHQTRIMSILVLV